MAKFKATKRNEIKRWTHTKSGTELVTYYCREAKVFWTQVGSEMPSALTEDAAVELAGKRADVLLCTEEGWERVIYVSPQMTDAICRVTSDGGHGSSGYRPDVVRSLPTMAARIGQITAPTLGFEAERRWERKGTDGNLYTRRWDQEARRPDDPIKERPGSDVSKVFGKETRVRLPYSDELWQALIDLSERIGKMAATFKLLLSKPEQLQRVLTSPAAALALEPYQHPFPDDAGGQRLYRCAGAHCPGLPYKASEQPHPARCSTGGAS